MNVTTGVETGTDADYKRHFTTIDILPQNFGFVKYFAMSLNFRLPVGTFLKHVAHAKRFTRLKCIIYFPPEFQNFLGSACHTLSSQGAA